MFLGIKLRRLRPYPLLRLCPRAAALCLPNSHRLECRHGHRQRRAHWLSHCSFTLEPISDMATWRTMPTKPAAACDTLTRTRAGWHSETVEPDIIGLSLLPRPGWQWEIRISVTTIMTETRILKHAYPEDGKYSRDGVREKRSRQPAGWLLKAHWRSPPATPSGKRSLRVAYGDTLADRLVLACRNPSGVWISQALANEASRAPVLLFTAGRRYAACALLHGR